jgi:hypothetical protein
MRGASFRDLAGADATPEDVQGMLELDETLFVEHKGTEPDYQLAKAMASFANQLGGWVLVNVNNREPLGDLPEWVTRAPSPIDALRDRLDGQIHPLPPFEARRIKLEPGTVLVVRVYESSDTPHILGDGAIYVRGVAQDRRSDPIYRPTLIENQQALLELVRRGERARARVGDLLAPGAHLPLANGGIGLEFERTAQGQAVVHADSPTIWVRLAPQTLTGRYAGWARSREALATAETALAELAGGAQLERTPHPQGFDLRSGVVGERAPTSERGKSLGGVARMAVDAAGLVTASLSFRELWVGDWTGPISLDEFAERYLAPVIRAPLDVLAEGEFLGRLTCHVWIRTPERVLRIEEGGKLLEGAGDVPYELELALPTAPGEIEQGAEEVARAFGRAGGLETFGSNA